MTVETDIKTVVGALMGGRFYPDVPPDGTVTRPYGTFSQVGGKSLAFLDGTAPSKKHGRFQINLWHTSRVSAAALALQVDNAMRGASQFQAEPIGEPQALYDRAQQLYGTQQDFSVWSDR